jgi:hypothetical protein
VNKYVGVLLAILFLGALTLSLRNKFAKPAKVSESDNVVVGAPLDPPDRSHHQTKHAVAFSIEPIVMAGKQAWLCTHHTDIIATKFRIEFDPTYATEQTETGLLSYGIGRMVHVDGSEPRYFLEQLALALEANHLEPTVLHHDSLSFTYVDFGHHFSPASGGGYQIKPPGDWIALKLFLGKETDADEGQVFLFLNPRTLEAELSEKDSVYGDIVLRHLASVF